MRPLTSNKVYSDYGSTYATITRLDNATPYTGNDVVGGTIGGVATSIIPFTNVLATKGVKFIITNVWLKIIVGAVPSGMTTFKLHLYNAAPTNISDNNVWQIPSGDILKYLGYIDMTAPTLCGTGGAMLFSQDTNINFTGKLATNSNTLYGFLQTIGGFTPTALTVKHIGIETIAA